MKVFKKFFALFMSAVLIFSFAGCTPKKADNGLIDGLFSDKSKISYSLSYTELKPDKKNKVDSWRQGMVSGDGMQGFVESGSPYEDTFIFQNMHFIMPNKNQRTCPDTSNELETVKQSIVNGEDIKDNASYDDVYSYHPGGQLRISMDGKKVDDYVRYTDYQTGQVGVRYTDSNGTWNRVSFTSFADSAVITKLEASDMGKKINATLSYDDLSSMANFGDGNEVDLKYKKIVSENADSLALVAHYPNYENSELKNGGYASYTYIITVGGEKQKVTLDKNIKEEFCSSNDGIKITDADEVYLITVSGRDTEMGEYEEFEEQESYDIISLLRSEAKQVEEKYGTEDGFDYESALERHLMIYQSQFNSVSLKLEDSSETNEALLKKQKGSKTIDAATAQRTYYAGRYAYLCCSGYSTSRLYGMWTGEFNTGWGSKYTMDANVNLQTSSLNSSNMTRTPVGYADFILRQVADWEENAKATHGFTDAIQAPVNTDGDKAVITETCYPYPFRYWNAGASWMLQPLFETLKAYGNIRISLSREYDIDSLKSVLSLSEDDVLKIKSRGFLMLEEDILYPLLLKSANYWAQLMTPEYYTDSDGKIHYEKGKTALNDGETYCILPSYSPENNPSNYPSPSAANCAIDIAACRDNIEMLRVVMNDVAPNADFSKWQALEDNLPPYLYDETGALKEWATTSFDENNKHRHLSHLYLAWPLNETQNNEELTKACIQAVENRTSENEASHALVHRSLIAARLKDRDMLSDALLKLMNHKIRYDSLMTNHDYDRGSCYCTDFAIGYLGIVNEALVYSDTGVIELLPALPTSGFDKGELDGLRTKSRAVIESLKWDGETVEAKIKSEIDQTITISYGNKSETLSLKQNETATVEF